MLTFSNKGLFHRFLTMFPNQEEPFSVCDLFWRVVLNLALIAGIVALAGIYLIGVYGWFDGWLVAGAERIRVFASTVSALITLGAGVWFALSYADDLKDKKRVQWMQETGGSYWEYQDLLDSQRKVRKAKLKPFMRKIGNGLELCADVVFALYKRVHDKTCVMVEFKAPDKT